MAMAKCFSIQQRCSHFYRNVLSTVFLLVFTVISKCLSNQEICTISNRRSVSYFEVAVQKANWTTAWLECVKQQARLPIICNREEQDAFINQLKGIGVNSTIWTAGRKINLTDWTWINGQRFMGEIIITSAPEYNTRGVLNEELRYRSAYPPYQNHYLCQYSGSSCNSGDVITVTTGCVRLSVTAGGEATGSWYEARNQCLKNGGDLAVLSDADLVALNRSNKLDARFSYWVGLRKNALLWIYQQKANSSEEVKYTNWSDGPHYPDNECISINTSNGEWKADRCADKNKVICERPLLSACHERESESVSKTTLVAVVIVGICTIVISNIIVALVVRKYASYRSSNVSSRTETAESRSYQDFETTRREANPNGTYTDLQLQPVYEEVSQRGK